MQVVHGFDEPAAYRGGVVSIGNFDGVHRGHRQMIAALIRCARGRKVPAVVFTFDPHPMAILRPGESPPPLTTTECKLELFERCEVDTVIVYPTDAQLLHLTAEEFFRDVVRGKLQAVGLVEGPNFYFGRNRAGTIHVLRDFCRASGVALEIVPPVVLNGQLVSSTVIRGLIAAGRVAEAAELLGEPYRVRGRVVKGAERGRTIGFPTANLSETQTVLPPDGVYAGRCLLGDQTYAVGINIGPNPTFSEWKRKVEAHLDGFQGDLYGQWLNLEFLARLRDTRKFSGLDELRNQLQADIEQTRALAKPRQPG